VLAVACRLPLLGGEFIDFDDSILIYENRVITRLSWPHLYEVLFTNFRGESQNPMHLANMLNWAVGDGAYWTFAASNLVWFAGTIGVVYAFARLFLADRGWALVATAFFAFHTVNVDNIGWMSARCHLMGMPFALGSFVAWQRYRESAGRLQWAWFAVANVAVAIAIWNKFIYVGVIPGLLLYEIYVRRRIDRSLALDKIPLAGVAALFALNPLVSGNANQGLAKSGAELATSFWTRVGLFVEYLGSLVVPRPTFLGAWFTAATGPFEPSYGLIALQLPPILNLGLLGVFAAFLLWLWQRGIRAPLFVGALAILFLLPSMGLRPGSPDVAFAFRYMLVPTVCFGVGLAAVGAASWERLHRGLRGVIASAFALLLCAHMGMSAHQAGLWRSPEAQYQSCIQHFPVSTVCHQRLAELARREGRHLQAIAYLGEVERVRSQYAFRRSMRSAQRLAEIFALAGERDLERFFIERALLRDKLSREQRHELRRRLRELR